MSRLFKCAAILVCLIVSTEGVVDYVQNLTYVGHPRTSVTLKWDVPDVIPGILYEYRIDIDKTNEPFGTYPVLNVSLGTIEINLLPYQSYGAVFVTTRSSVDSGTFVNETDSEPLFFTAFDALHPLHIALYAVIAWLVFISVFFMVLGKLRGPKTPEPI